MAFEASFCNLYFLTSQLWSDQWIIFGHYIVRTKMTKALSSPIFHPITHHFLLSQFKYRLPNCCFTNMLTLLKIRFVSERYSWGFPHRTNQGRQRTIIIFACKVKRWGVWMRKEPTKEGQENEGMGDVMVR